ncbi:MAG: PQQ-binding-like beta-propeller repeat protein, partial [Candidatus Aenigmarchaeota archaeon]|nr:PQQ-binding-like beta-propeller repeat protein [Candidatus Aenigmarchaeota archaeon]
MGFLGKFKLVLILIFLISSSFLIPIIHGEDWPMFGGNLKRTGYTSDQVNPPTGPGCSEAVWVRDFFTGNENEADLIGSNIQPLVVGNQVFVASLKNRVYALDTGTGSINWVIQLTPSGKVFTTPSISGVRMYLGSTNGYFYILDINNGNVIDEREITQIGGFRSSPVVVGNNIFIGGEDGYFYALDVNTLNELWRYNSGAPIISSPSVDENYQRIYFSNEAMHGFALDFSGNEVWKTQKFHGTSTRNFYPVVVGSGSSAKIVFRTAPGDAHQALNGGDTALSRAAGITVQDDFTHMRADQGVDINANPVGSDLEDERSQILNFLESYPEYKTFYAVDAATGTESVEMPILWTQGSSEVGEPPVISPDGTVYLKSRSYYSDFDVENSAYWFGTPVILDLNTGGFSLIESSTGGNNPYSTGLFLISDEQAAPLLGGNRLYYNNHADSTGSISISGTSGIGEKISVCRDRPHGVSHGNNPDADRVPYVPFNLGTTLKSVRFIGHGGSGNCGLTSSLGDNKFFYISHGMLGMYKQNGGGMSYLHNEWIEPDYGSVTVPLTSELNSYVTEVPTIPSSFSSTLANKLEEEINNFIEAVLINGWNSNTHYQPFLYPNGKGHPGRYFVDPTEEAYVLGLAYPFVSNSTQSDIRKYVNSYLFDIYSNPLSQSFSSDGLTGRRRERYYINNNLGTEALSGYIPTYSYQTRVYNLWSYVYHTSDWTFVSSYYNAIKSYCDGINSSSNDNGNFANLVGCYHIAQKLDHSSDASNYLNKATNLLRNRLEWEQDNPPNPWMAESIDSAFSSTNWAKGAEIVRYKNLNYELGRALYDYARQPMEVQNKFIETAMPAQIIGEGFSVHRTEVFSNLPHQARDIFLQKAFIMGLSSEKLGNHISSSWCNGDLYYMERLALTLRASEGSYPTTTSTPQPTTTSTTTTTAQPTTTIATTTTVPVDTSPEWYNLIIEW